MSQIRRGGGWAVKYQHKGKQVWVPGGPFKTKKEAIAAETAHRQRFSSHATCTAFSKRWLEEWPRKSVATRRLYADAARRFSREFGDRDLSDINRVEARTWALSIPRNYSKIIGTMYSDAHDVGLVEQNPFANLRLPATEKTEEIAPPSPDEYRQLLAACMVLGGYAEEFRALIQLTAWTGLRASEVMALKADDFEARHLNVRRARKDDGTYGLSVESGQPISDARLERLPAAERTADEQRTARRQLQTTYSNVDGEPARPMPTGLREFLRTATAAEYDQLTLGRTEGR